MKLPVAKCVSEKNQLAERRGKSVGGGCRGRGCQGFWKKEFVLMKGVSVK